MTNFEKKIKEMTVEEFAVYMSMSIDDCIDCPCVDTCTEFEGEKCEETLARWLRQERRTGGKE